jgi:hypothetical protein
VKLKQPVELDFSLRWDCGRVPVKYFDLACCGIGLTLLPTVERAYLVLVVADALVREQFLWSEVLFARLRADTVRVIASMLPGVKI